MAPSRRSVLVFVVAALAVLLCIDLVIRLSSSQLARPLLHYSVETQVLADDLDALEAAGVQSDLTFVGSSMVGRAVFPDVFEVALGGIDAVHNLGLPAASTEVAGAWTTNEVIPALQPRCIAWGMSSMDFNSGRAPQPTINLYDNATATRPGVMGGLERGLNDVWATYRYRHVILDEFDLGEGVGPDVRQRPITDRGDFDKTEWTSTRNEFETARIEDEVLANFAIGDAEVGALRTGVERFSADAEVVVISMPVPPSYIDRHPAQGEDFDEFRSVLAAETEALAVTFIDASAWMTEDDFHDYTHLSAAPARAFSAMLAEEFDRLGFCA